MIPGSRWALIILAVASALSKHRNGNHEHDHHHHHNKTMNSTGSSVSPRPETQRGTESSVSNITGPTLEPITGEPDIRSVEDVIYLLHSEEAINGTTMCQRCRDILITCQNSSSTFTTMIKEGPIRPNAHHYSSLIQYRREYGLLHIPIEVNDDFLQHLVLLHNNTDQLHVLLALFRSLRGVDWMTYLAGYNECGHSNSRIFTCVNDVCTQHDLLALKYTNDLFAEDVLGLELSPPTMFVLVRLRNKAAKTSRVIRIEADTLSLLDSTYNLIRTVFDDIPGLGRELVETLYLYRERFPAVFSITEGYRAHTFPHHTF